VNSKIILVESKKMFDIILCVCNVQLERFIKFIYRMANQGCEKIGVSP
jgi:hypothetical protein